MSPRGFSKKNLLDLQFWDYFTGQMPFPSPNHTVKAMKENYQQHINDSKLTHTKTCHIILQSHHWMAHVPNCKVGFLCGIRAIFQKQLNDSYRSEWELNQSRPSDSSNLLILQLQFIQNLMLHRMWQSRYHQRHICLLAFWYIMYCSAQL